MKEFANVMFNQLKQLLRQKLEQVQENIQLVEITAEIDITVENQILLAWLKEQNHFPHYFWQSRDEEKTFVAIGAVRQFYQLTEVKQFIQDYPFHLLGGLTFEGQCHFILPRLCLIKMAKKLIAHCYVENNKVTQTMEWLDNLPSSLPFSVQKTSLIACKSAINFPVWKQNITSALNAFQTTKLSKVVLANATTLDFDAMLDPYNLLFVSQQTNMECYHFLWSETGERTFIGSSPERLYQRQSRAFQTEALAGTVAVSKDRDQTERNALWLLSDPKNRYENWLVVDDICQHLANYTTDIQIGEAEIKRLKNVQHLRRLIKTTLFENVSDTDCLARIHPTAAVAGLPRPEAKAFIQQNECFKRGWYAGTLGYMCPKNAEFCVTLRSALITQRQMTIYAGAGIVEGSDALTEWQEIERKSLAMANLVLDKPITLSTNDKY